MFVGRDHHVVGPALSRANISSFEIILDKFTRAEIKLFQMDVDEGWNNLWNNVISHVTMA